VHRLSFQIGPLDTPCPCGPVFFAVYGSPAAAVLAVASSLVWCVCFVRRILRRFAEWLYDSMDATETSHFPAVSLRAVRRRSQTSRYVESRRLPSRLAVSRTVTSSPLLFAIHASGSELRSLARCLELVYFAVTSMRTKAVTALSSFPVLVSASAGDQEGLVVSDLFLPPTLARRLGADDLADNRFLRSFQNSRGQQLVAEKQEFLAIAKLISAYKLRMHPSRSGEWKEVWKEALEEYEQSLRTSKETRPLPEDRKARREFGRQIIEIIAPAIGLDLGAKSPERAADEWDGYLLSRSAKSSPQLLLGRIISNHLHHVRVVLWVSKGCLQPALYCSSARDALYAIALLSLNERKGLAVCRYSRCGKPFQQSRPDQECCSARHTDTHRMAVYRMTPRGRRAMERDSRRRKQRKERAQMAKNRRRSKKSRRASTSRSSQARRTEHDA
jgi:hypothetical protein